MPPKRPNLILDEQAFQDLLSAAFTIQEHNARLRVARKNEPPSQALPEAVSETEATTFCPHCGAAKSPQDSHCANCGREEFRPGELMQRKWASMWLMSQERELWPERWAEAGEVQEIRPEIGEDRQEDVAASEAEAEPVAGSMRDSGDDSFHPAPLARETRREAAPPAQVESEVFGQRLDQPALADNAKLEHVSAESEWNEESAALREAANEASAAAVSHLDAQTLDAQTLPWPASSPPAGDDAFSTGVAAMDESPMDESPRDERMIDSEASAARTPGAAAEAKPDNLGRRLAGLRVTLRFHRADLYLAAALLLFGVALLWPTVSGSRPAALSPMERVLIALGIAEAPAAPAVHPKGDPTIDVWVDPHTALYYCPDDERYGKTPDGRVSTQRDAQMDRFQPAGRSPCE